MMSIISIIKSNIFITDCLSITPQVGPSLLEALGGHPPDRGTEALSLKVPAQLVGNAVFFLINVPTLLNAIVFSL
jgi:hypothetical protein